MADEFTKAELYEAIKLLECSDEQREHLEQLVDTGQLDQYYVEMLPLLKAEEASQQKQLDDLSKDPEDLLKYMAEEKQNDQEIEKVMDQYYEDRYEKPLQEIEEEDKRLTAEIDKVNEAVLGKINSYKEQASKQNDQTLMQRLRDKIRKK